jgi:hypothetical protein
MKRSYDDSDNISILSVKRLKEPPSYDIISPFVKKIHKALGGIALSTVQYPDDTSICLFSIKSPPMSIDMEKMNNLLEIENIDFVLYKGREERTLYLQITVYPLIKSLTDIENESVKIDSGDSSFDKHEKRLIRWMESIRPFNCKVTKRGLNLWFTAKNEQEQLSRHFFNELYESKLEWIKDYKIFLKKDKLVVIFKFTP